MSLVAPVSAVQTVVVVEPTPVAVNDSALVSVLRMGARLSGSLCQHNNVRFSRPLAKTHLRSAVRTRLRSSCACADYKAGRQCTGSLANWLGEALYGSAGSCGRLPTDR